MINQLKKIVFGFIAITLAFVPFFATLSISLKWLLVGVVDH